MKHLQLNPRVHRRAHNKALTITCGQWQFSVCGDGMDDVVMISVTQHTEETATQHLAKEYSTCRCRGCANINDERGGCVRYVEGGDCVKYV